jgi:glyoxylase-like metal-dependent hydrolase (beta-lactamase superfamily II)
MIDLHDHGDVERIEMSSWRTRAVGLSVSAYLVRGVLVDAGFIAADRELAALLRARRPRGALITHQHEDHAGNVALLAALGVPVALAPETLDVLRTPGRIGFYRRWTWGAVPALGAITPFADDAISLVPTPGHSSDHHAVWDAETRTLFAGDLFLGVRVRIAHAREDPRELARSVRRAAALEPRRLFDAHRGEVRDPVAALLAKADWLDETLAAIDARIERGWSDDAIQREVLGAESWVGRFSVRDYSKRALVRAARRTHGI